MSKARFHLGALNPVARFALVFTASTLFILVNDILGASLLFLGGLALFLLGEKRNWRIVLSAPFSGGMMLLYNSIFSPENQGGLRFLFLTINQAGIERGLVTGLRLTGIMFISFAWLAATPIPEMYEGLGWLRPAREWTLGILRGVQILQREFVVLTQSLIIRGLRWDSIRANIKNLVPLAVAIMPRVIDNTQKAAFAGQSHKQAVASGKGEISAKGLFVRYGPQLPDVLAGVSLSMEPGEFAYLAGKSASGKTTLLRAIGGVIPWIMGELKGSIVSSGMVPFETALPVLTGSVRYVAPDPFASIHGLTVGQEIQFLAKNENEAKRALNTMGIGALWERETTKLSGGQQVRLVLAGALASGASVLLLDAPMQELDPQGRSDFMEALAILRQKRSTTMIVADPFWRVLKPHCQKVLEVRSGAVSGLAPEQFFNPEGILRCNLDKVSFGPKNGVPGNIVAHMDGVEVALDGNTILRDMDFAIREGELVAIVGPNGSGKTTAMLTLAGAIRARKGKVERVGRTGYIFQNAALQLLSMTVEEELAFGPKVLRWETAKIQSFVKHGLLWSGLEPLACPIDLHPADQRLLAIAACNTEVSTLVFDEPTIGLDSQGVVKVVALIDALRVKGKAIVVITHDVLLAQHADRVVTIEGGKVSKEVRDFVSRGGGM